MVRRRRRLVWKWFLTAILRPVDRGMIRSHIGPAILLMGLLMAAAQADENQTRESEEPDAEFLEFLGSFESDDGTWMDPQVLIDAETEDPKGGDHE